MRAAWIVVCLACTLDACDAGRGVEAPVQAAKVAMAVREDAAPATAPLFDWAADTYPDLFSGTPVSGQYLGYSYRYYPDSANYLGVDGAGGVYVLGPVSGGAILKVGKTDDFASQVQSWATQLGTFPRIGSIWWGSAWMANDPAHASKMRLMLAPAASTASVLALRAKGPPGALYLFNVNATSDVSSFIEGFVPQPAPEAYYLHDTQGRRILMWPPNEYQFNLTNPEVAEFIAKRASDALDFTHGAYDGVFFDNFHHAVSYLTQDFYGNPIQISSRNDGKADDPATLDAAWNAGVQHLLTTFRALQPRAYLSAHADGGSVKAQDLAGLNGIAVLGPAVDIREGLDDFAARFDDYRRWQSEAVAPRITLVQASPPNQIAYGYSYRPDLVMTPSLAAWSRTTYANMRFGLGFALMANGYFSFDFGDNSASTTWWYDEYDFNLGLPMGPAVQLPAGNDSPQLITNGNFANGLNGWLYFTVNDTGAKANFSASSHAPAAGGHSAQVDIVSPGKLDWHIDLEQNGLAFVRGTTYEVSFSAAASVPLTMSVKTQGGPPGYTDYGMYAQIPLTTTWQTYRRRFTANTTASDGRLEFWFGQGPGRVWLSDVRLSVQAPQVYRRDFELGVVLLNGTASRQVIPLEAGLAHFNGGQAPRHDVIVDDGSGAFTASSTNGAPSWIAKTVDSGLRKQVPPYYHAWNLALHQTSAAADFGVWSFDIEDSDRYSFKAWLPAAPDASGWTHKAVYSLLADGLVLASVTLDQSQAQAGDQWWPLFNDVQLAGAKRVELRVSNGGTGALVADAIQMSSKARLNDGTAVSSITLEPFDAVLLQRTGAAPARARQPLHKPAAAAAAGP